MMSQLLPEQKKGFVFHFSDSHEKALPGKFKRVQIIDKDTGTSDCRPLLVKKEEEKKNIHRLSSF